MSSVRNKIMLKRALLAAKQGNLVMDEDIATDEPAQSAEDEWK